MADNQVTTLPASVAAILGTTDEKEARERIAHDRLRIAQLEEQLVTEKATAKRALDDLDTYRNEAADSAVAELVKLELIKDKDRATAQDFARTNLAGFNEMYAEQRAALAKRTAPKAHLLDTVAEVKNDHKPATKPLANMNARMRATKARIMRDEPGLSLEEAYSRAAVELDNEASK